MATVTLVRDGHRRIPNPTRDQIVEAMEAAQGTDEAGEVVLTFGPAGRGQPKLYVSPPFDSVGSHSQWYVAFLR